MRREYDFYPTASYDAVSDLLKYWQIPRSSRIFECCNGEGHLSASLRKNGFLRVEKGDIASYRGIGNLAQDTRQFDATSEDYWELTYCDYTITNPPFSLAHEIIPLAYEYSIKGVAMLLRLSYLEPCRNRALWMQEHPLSKLIAIPRISFTGDGKTDKVATAWFVWDKTLERQQIAVVPRNVS